jgi:hypothetical protein
MGLIVETGRKMCLFLVIAVAWPCLPSSIDGASTAADLYLTLYAEVNMA